VKLLAVLAGIASLVAVALAQEKKVKDAEEHKLFSTAASPGDPKARLAALEEWKQKYPESDFKLERLLLFIDVHKALNQGAKMWEVSKEVLKLDANNPTAHYWLTALVETMPQSPDTFTTGEASAKALVALPKPGNVPADQWDKMVKGEFSPLAYKTLGFIASARKDYPTAETNYKKALEFQPNFGIVSYALGASIIAQKKPDRYPEALFHMARAVSLRGVGEVPAALRTNYDAFLTKAYNTYHGSPQGLDELKATAAKSATPPEGFQIDSVAEIAEKKDKELLSSNPQLAIWLRVKGQLTADNGQAYFDNELKGSAVPKLKGKVISASPEAKPKEIVVGVENPDQQEIKLVVSEGTMPTKADPGTEIEFEGVPTGFTKEPFLLTMDIEREKISGWPEAPKPARRPATKSSAKKKK
jgi:tetratricopeptide (TPR) repeat protein